MALFLTKDGRRKSPMALTIFFVALLYCLIFAAAYALLTEPLYTWLPLGGGMAATAVHCTLIALAGTAACCALFLLPDKRVVPYSFAGLTAVPLMLCAASLQLAEEQRGMMLYVTLLYTLMPVLVGNLVSWTLYLKLWRGKRRPQDF